MTFAEIGRAAQWVVTLSIIVGVGGGALVAASIFLARLVRS